MKRVTNLFGSLSVSNAVMKERSPSPKEKNDCEDKDEEDGDELFSSLRGSIQEY